MSELKGSKTHENLVKAFTAESEASRRYLYFAQQADVEGYPEVAALFRGVADSETGHAIGHFDFLSELDDPATGLQLGSTADHLRAAVAAETREAAELYPEFSKVASDEGFPEIADWFESLGRAEDGHASRLSASLSQLEEH